MRRFSVLTALLLALSLTGCLETDSGGSGGGSSGGGSSATAHPDRDGDGIWDTYDRYPDGQDVRDADGDRIVDAYDRYPNGEDRRDSDADGLPDVYDQAPQTPRAVPAPPNGSVPAPTRTPGPPTATVPSYTPQPDAPEPPEDTDRDGIPDSRDVNPTTPENSDPDHDGVLTRDDRWPHDAMNDTDDDGDPNLYDHSPLNDGEE